VLENQEQNVRQTGKLLFAKRPEQVKTPQKPLRGSEVNGGYYPCWGLETSRWKDPGGKLSTIGSGKLIEEEGESSLRVHVL